MFLNPHPAQPVNQMVGFLPDRFPAVGMDRELIPSEWGWANQVSVGLAEQQVTAEVRSRLACGPLGEPVTRRFLESTGWHLRLKAVRR